MDWIICKHWPTSQYFDAVRIGLGSGKHLGDGKNRRSSWPRDWLSTPVAKRRESELGAAQ